MIISEIMSSALKTNDSGNITWLYFLNH